MAADDGIKILIIDDSLTMRRTLGRILQEDYTVETAEDGAEGIALFQSFLPDILLLDVNMPQVDGFEVIEHVRSVCRDQETVIIMLTAEESMDLKPKALDMGANDFLYKPFDRIELISRVGVAARQVRLTRQLKEYAARITREIEEVAELQRRLLPQELPDVSALRLASLYLPSGQASGDYFDYFPLTDSVLRVVVADVSGHGARAAFLMGIVRTLFRTTQTNRLPLDQTFDLVNKTLMQIIGEENDFISVFAADIDHADQRMTYLNAGHCPGLLKDPDNAIHKLSPQTPILGFFDVPLPMSTMPFAPGSELFLFTDGFYEWETEPGRFLDQDVFWRLASKVILHKGQFLENLMKSLTGMAKDEPRFRDDLTALWIKADPR